MTSLTRVVWNEGMHLAQHHFQAQGRYFEELLSFARTSLLFEPWGLAGYDLDADALANDTVALTAARGIMPDGLAFAFPEEPLPEPLEIRELFSPTADSHRVLLGIPPFVEGGANATAEGAGPTGPRFDEVRVPMTDEVTGRDAKPVGVGKKRFRLHLETEEVDGLVTLPIARVRRDGSGHFVFDSGFVPPCVHVGASPRLMRLVMGMIEVISGRIDSLSVEHDSSPGEIASHWLAHSLHSALAPLLHVARLRHAHPADLYVELARLAGALSTFALNSQPHDLPLYDHRHLGECFGTLERRINDALGVVVPVNCLRFSLQPRGESFFATTIADSRCYSGPQWYLGVRSSLLPTQIVADVPRLVKVCSEKHIRRLVVEAFSGLEVEHVVAPPAQISPRAGTEYFVVRKVGPCWSSVVESREIGAYAPAALPDVELEVVIPLEST
ncbi:MAG: type VI secretion system baseplate subunit TssK [Gemmatimonas sp.]|nr:type VI secretion system baseplate subunit TssK [Gemmatimonas sp.]